MGGDFQAVDVGVLAGGKRGQAGAIGGDLRGGNLRGCGSGWRRAGGMGIHKFRDPELEEAFATVPLAIEVAGFHSYGVDWRPGSAAFMVDGAEGALAGAVAQLSDAADVRFSGEGGQRGQSVPVPELVDSPVRGQSGGERAQGGVSLTVVAHCF